MTRKAWFDLSPSLLMGIGIVASTWISVVVARSGGPVLAGPLLLALAIVGGDVLGFRLRGAALRAPAQFVCDRASVITRGISIV